VHKTVGEDLPAKISELLIATADISANSHMVIGMSRKDVKAKVFLSYQQKWIRRTDGAVFR
jgi:hypothetical protein